MATQEWKRLRPLPLFALSRNVSCTRGVAVPVQGGIGPWHFMVIATLVCFGVNENDAAAFALVVHTVQTVWTGLCGLFGVVALPLTNRENKEAPVAVS